MKINPYLNFEGNCREAFAFYEELLGGKITAMLPFSEMPTEANADAESCSGVMPADLQDKIMHGSMEVAGVTLMASDAVGPQYVKPQGMHLSVQIENVDEAERIFAALSEGGTVTMPIEETFWAKRFGMCTDRFGTPWMVNCDNPEFT